jgi:uncharacterized protein YijF (DUF1287 family)
MVEPVEDGQSVALLILPFVLLALAIGVSQSFRPSSRLAGSVVWPAPGNALDTGAAAALRSAVLARPPREGRAQPRLAPDVSVALVDAPPVARFPPALPLSAAAQEPTPASLTAPDEIGVAASPDLLVTSGPLPVAKVIDPGAAAIALAPGPLVLPRLPTTLTALSPSTLSGAETEPLVVQLGPVAEQLPILTLAAHAPVTAEAGVCTIAQGARPAARPAGVATAVGLEPEGFAAQLAAAAVRQTRELVIYNDQYRRLRFPMGDVPPLFGVCTDVVVRAYRSLGIDLQALVQLTGSGSGDANIDHRRTEVLRRFFALQGAALPVTDFAEDYRPGDIVTYHRPQNQHSRSHIAVVSDRIGPSGRPMIVHNRGWGPQLEDGLFVDQITGHYRFAGLRGHLLPPVPMATLPSPRSLTASRRLRRPAEPAAARSATPAALAEQTPAGPGTSTPRVR